MPIRIGEKVLCDNALTSKGTVKAVVYGHTGHIRYFLVEFPPRGLKFWTSSSLVRSYDVLRLEK